MLFRLVREEREEEAPDSAGRDDEEIDTHTKREWEAHPMKKPAARMTVTHVGSCAAKERV